MRLDRTRLARRLLLALLVVVTGAVAWSLRRPAPRPGPAEPGAAPSPGQGTTVSNGSLLRFSAGKQKVQVKFRQMVGQEGDATHLTGVEVTLPFAGQGRESIATITADDCLYQSAAQRAAFKGNVHVKTDDGFELESETLKYWGDKNRVFTRDPVKFRRGGTSGSANGMEYSAGEGVTLIGDVHVRLEQGAGPPAEVESATAWGSRDERQVRFEGGVLARQAGRELRAQKLQLNLNEDLSAVERAAAIEDVDLVTAPGAALPGQAAPGGGTKRLQCRRLNVVYREKGVLQEALAVNSASLEIDPAPGQAPEKRRVSAPQLRFGFDEEGRLVSLQGLPARQTEPGADKFALLTTEPVPPSQAPKRSLRSDRFDARLDPESGDVSGATFEGAVAFEEPGRRGFAAKAVYEDGPGIVTLTGDPRIVDEDQGSELRGKRIRLGTRESTVAASENVRHTVTPKKKTARPGLMGGDQPAVLYCRDFDYDPRTKTAHYKQNALLQSGKDEVRAPTIVIEEDAAGTRKLTASGGTTSVLHPRPQKGAGEGQKAPPKKTGTAPKQPAEKEPVPVEARSKDMVYDEAANTVVYTGDVQIHQGDIVTRSPKAVVTLTKDGGDVEKLVAGEPVDLLQGARHAKGREGTYTPGNGTLVLVGDPVVLQEVDRRLEGRILIFEEGSDRIRVDGREEVRTEAVFQKKEPPKP
jgi:lipopolysaccharide transport protein LptA/LPS export ABC transporter protein LptC